MGKLRSSTTTNVGCRYNTIINHAYWVCLLTQAFPSPSPKDVAVSKTLGLWRLYQSKTCFVKIEALGTLGRVVCFHCCFLVCCNGIEAGAYCKPPHSAVKFHFGTHQTQTFG